jgi:hypothetical protein
MRGLTVANYCGWPRHVENIISYVTISVCIWTCLRAVSSRLKCRNAPSHKRVFVAFDIHHAMRYIIS